MFVNKIYKPYFCHGKMGTKCFCDRCGKDIDIQSDEFSEIVENLSSAFGKESQIIQPQLCGKCGKGYKKIIFEANKKIEDYLSKNKVNKDF